MMNVLFGDVNLPAFRTQLSQPKIKLGITKEFTTGASASIPTSQPTTYPNYVDMLQRVHARSKEAVQNIKEGQKTQNCCGSSLTSLLFCSIHFHPMNN